MLPVWTVDTGCLLAFFAEERLHRCSLQSQCFNVHAFWKGLIGIFKMIHLVSWVFRMNIKSNVSRIHPGMEVFRKDFSYHFHQLVIDALIIKYDIFQKKACCLDLREHKGSSGYEKTLGCASRLPMDICAFFCLVVKNCHRRKQPN